MKRFLLLCLLMSSPVFAQMAASVMVKQHDARPDFAERPYGKDDMSYGLFFDAFDGKGGWRFGAMYSDDVTGISAVETVITPEIALLVADRIWETSIAVLIDYVEGSGESEWGDVYFQTQLGFNIPLGNSVMLGAHAFYPMESIGDLVDIGFNDLDFAVQLRIFF